MFSGRSRRRYARVESSAIPSDPSPYVAADDAYTNRAPEVSAKFASRFVYSKLLLIRYSAFCSVVEEQAPM